MNNKESIPAKYKFAQTFTLIEGLIIGVVMGYFQLWLFLIVILIVFGFMMYTYWRKDIKSNRNTENQGIRH